MSNKRFPKIALKNITVYKLLYEDDSPYFCRGYKYKKGVNYPEGKFDVQRMHNTTFINGGYLHAYLDRRLPEAVIEHSEASDVKIVEMKIPFGTRYYSGYRDICAKKLVW